MDRFVVYAASAIYIIGLPEIMQEFDIGEQEALLGLSLYVFACKTSSEGFSLSFANPFQTVWAPWSGHRSANSPGSVEGRCTV